MINEELQEYEYPYCNNIINFEDTVRIHSQNINNIPIEAIKLKNKGMIKEIKTRQRIYIYGRK